jgi:undecaprenyl-diphosphatase
MPTSLTIFAASDLIYLDVVLAAAIVVWALYRRPARQILWWVIAICTTCIVAIVGALIGSSLYNDPRPFAVDHVHPLIAHAADNGFPSDHSLLAAVLVAAVILARPRYTLLFVVLAAAVEWARVGAGVHHPIDVIGSDLFVSAGLIIGILLANALTDRLLPYIPARLLAFLPTPLDHAA